MSWPLSLRPAALVICGVTILGGLTSSCGTRDDDPGEVGAQGSASPSVSVVAGAPECADVWVHGQPMPESYQGCNDPDSGFVEAVTYQCDSGQVLVTYADRYYGALGSWVNDIGESLTTSPKFDRVKNRC